MLTAIRVTGLRLYLKWSSRRVVSERIEEFVKLDLAKNTLSNSNTDNCFHLPLFLKKELST